MERNAYRVAFPVALVVVMAAFITGLFMTDATPSHAASDKKKTAEVRKTAAEHTESRIKQLETALKITDEQRNSWNEVTRVMRENASDMDVLTKDRSEKAKTMNAVERMRFHNQVTEAQLNQQKKFIVPFEALYNGMSDAQKVSTDAIFRTGRHGKHRIK